jgi:hypothetical protein
MKLTIIFGGHPKQQKRTPLEVDDQSVAAFYASVWLFLLKPPIPGSSIAQQQKLSSFVCAAHQPLLYTLVRWLNNNCLLWTVMILLRRCLESKNIIFTCHTSKNAFIVPPLHVHSTLRLFWSPLW